MYEVEFKIELTNEERNQIIKALTERDFLQKEPLIQRDCYVESVESPYGGYNLKRYRNENGKIFYTHKTWEMVSGETVRREEEREASQTEFEESLKTSSSPITIKKERLPFEGSYLGTQIHIDMDTIKFGHSPKVRFFIEAEIITAEKEEVKSIKDFIREFLKVLLRKDELVESPGMFTMAFEKK